MKRIIPYTEEILSTWRTSRLGCYLLNMLSLKGKLEGVESQIEQASRAIRQKSVLERKAFIGSMKRNIRAQYASNGQRAEELFNLATDFCKYAFR